MPEWQEIPDNGYYGIVIYSLHSDGEGKLSANVGEALHLKKHEDNWYFGYSICNSGKSGIIPKTYIQVIDCKIETVDGVTYTYNLQPPIVQELTQVLREWGILWKQLYISNKNKFDELKSLIYELINYRSKITSGTLPVDELKQVTKEVTGKIATGNNTLGLDLVVRDGDGNIIDPDKTSTIKLYRFHGAALESSKNKTETKEQTTSVMKQYSHIFLVSVINFTSKMSENAELLMFLYDAKEFKPITENYVVQWSKDGLMRNLDQMNNLRVMFTDLGKSDLQREKIYLVCYVIRAGSMEAKEPDRRSSTSSNTSKKGSPNDMRRPFGVAARDVTSFVSGTVSTDFEKEYAIPFFSCDKDNLEQTLRKILNKEDSKSENKNQSLFVKMKLLHGDIKQVREENPHLILGNVSIARKMGFPEVILPGDVRNDLYLTLISGEFPKGHKKSDKNVEVTVLVCNEEGSPIPGVISVGGGVQPINNYHSVIYYHEDKPQWHETFKVNIQIEEFKQSHIKFLFKHRSSNELKDKNEKPFAMAHVKLLQKDGTTLRDAKHNVAIYKIDQKKYVDGTTPDYLKLNSCCDDNDGGQVVGLNLSHKDTFTISTNICSTKLTQNVNLLGLLNWTSHKDSLIDSLKNLEKIDGDEIVKFLQDILDTLFSILMHNLSTTEYDASVFRCLLHVIGIVTNNWKYLHFQPVLDLYIKDSFSATLVYKKMILVLNDLFCDPLNEKDTLFTCLKLLQYIMRFISKSRQLYMELDEEDDTYEFEQMMSELLESIVKLMCQSADDNLRQQGAVLKYLPTAISDIINIFDVIKLSDFFCKLFCAIPENKLTKQKIMTMNDIVDSPLFLYTECRKILLPIFTHEIKKLLEQNEETEICIKITEDILILLFERDKISSYHSIEEIIITHLRTITQCYIKMDKENPFAKNLVAIMIDIFRQMSRDHYLKYIEHFPTRSDVLDFLMEILMIFKELVNQSIFPKDWSEMIMLQNHVIYKAMCFISVTIVSHFTEKFEQQLWNNFFHCAIAFMTQPSLQLENFTTNKRLRIIKRYQDLRRQMGFEVRAMWFNLGKFKVKFVPSLVENILEMTLIPETELRKATVPIFFDMMQCEYFSSAIEFESYGDTVRNSQNSKGNFKSFENEIIAKLDILIEGGRGDEMYRQLFYTIMYDLCSHHQSLCHTGLKFVDIVTKLMDRLLQYRNVMYDENKENRMICIVSLLDFYSEINRKEMYIRYVNKLYDLHLECENFTEAAYTLDLYSKLLNWSDEVLFPLLKSSRFPDALTHRQLKEELYYKIITNFSDGKMWECALDRCKELAKQFEEETFDYDALSKLHKRISEYYDSIMKHIRPEPEYFRVAYYGLGFPKFLQNKVFIYRGKPYERLGDFSTRTMNEFPKAELFNKLTDPDDDIKSSNKQYIQINKVDPAMELNKRFSGRPVYDQIMNFYKVNHVNTFQFSRRFRRKDPSINEVNEFATMWIQRSVLKTEQTLPNILMWFPVSEVKVFDISPLNNAIETMQNANKELRTLFLRFKNDHSMQVNSLSLKLNGVLDPAVMGGIVNYEEAFFTDEYLENHPEDEPLLNKLKELIAEQVPIVELCVEVHKQLAPENLQPLQARLEDCFAKMKENIYTKYGKKTCSDINLESTVVLRRQFSRAADDSRSSELSTISERSSQNGFAHHTPSLPRLNSTFN